LKKDSKGNNYKKGLKLPAPRCRESSRQGKGLFVVVRSLTHAASCGECARYSCSRGQGVEDSREGRPTQGFKDYPKELPWIALN
jgi:hypothetical protein